jgi:hypothetical protein
VICAAVLLAFSVGVWVRRLVPTRKCPRCATKVELGRRGCQNCGYRFIN